MTSLEGWSSTIELRPRRRPRKRAAVDSRAYRLPVRDARQDTIGTRRAGDKLDTALLVRQRHTRDGIVNHEADREETSS
jgi:hypothetical protein